MFEIDDDFDLDEVLDTVSILEEAALRSSGSSKANNSDSKSSDAKQCVQNDDSLQSSFKCPVKRKSDTEADINTILPKRSSMDCLRLLESSTQQLSPVKPLSPTQPRLLTLSNEVLDCQEPIGKVSKYQSPKNTTIWKMGNAGNTSGCGMRTIPAACQRKFPGPAGLLPERTNRVSYALNESGVLNTLSEPEIPLCSQPTQTLDVGPWQALRCDLQGARDLLDKYTITWVKQKVANRRLAGQKIPFLAAVLHNVDASSPDPVIVLRDKTGYINGSIHRSVWECHGGQLLQGSALVLRLVGVACTGSATQQRLYINVTSNNIITIYSPSPDGDVNVTEVNPLDIKEMRERISEWEAKCKVDAVAANTTAQSPSLFSSVLDRTPLRQIVPASPANTAVAPSPTFPARNAAPQRPAVLNNNLQKTVTSVPNQTSKTPNLVSHGSSPGFVPKTSTFMSRVELPKTSNQANQNKVVTSTQTGDAEKISLEVSRFLDGLDTDMLFDDF